MGHASLCPPELSFGVLPGTLGTPVQLLPGLPAVRRERVATLRAGEQVKVHIYSVHSAGGLHAGQPPVFSDRRSSPPPLISLSTPLQHSQLFHLCTERQCPLSTKCAAERVKEVTLLATNEEEEMLGGPEFRGDLLQLGAKPQGWEGRTWGGSALPPGTVLGTNVDVSRTYCPSPFCP